MAYEADTPDNEENCTQDCDGPSIDPQYIADRARDVRLACLHAAIQLYRPGDADAEIILRTAELFHNFANGVNLPAPVQA
jgi:hypothetical protein